MELKELLVLLDRRWKVAGQYLRIIEDFWDRVELRPSAVEEIALMRRFRVV